MLGVFLTSPPWQPKPQGKQRPNFPVGLIFFFLILFFCVDHKKGPAWEDWAREESQDFAVKISQPLPCGGHFETKVPLISTSSEVIKRGIP